MKLTIDHISKHFKDKIAVDDVSLTLTPGVWGLLGANGAGKTTLMRMIADITNATKGEIRFDGNEVHRMGAAYRSIFGILPQEFGYPHEMNIADYLEYMSALKDVPKARAKKKIDGLLDVLTLSDVKKKKISELSGGMKRRVGIAQAMLNDPDVLILDEPTAGLDPGERVRFRNFISEFARDRIVLMSTHIVSDVEYIAAQIAIMKDGKIIDVGTPDKIVKGVEGKVWSCKVLPSMVTELETKLRIINQRLEEDGRVSLRYLSDDSQVAGSQMMPPRLEDLYLWLFPDDAKDSE